MPTPSEDPHSSSAPPKSPNLHVYKTYSRWVRVTVLALIISRSLIILRWTHLGSLIGTGPISAKPWRSQKESPLQKRRHPGLAVFTSTCPLTGAHASAYTSRSCGGHEPCSDEVPQTESNPQQWPRPPPKSHISQETMNDGRHPPLP